MQREQPLNEDSYSFKIVDQGEFEYDESIPVENAREVPSPILHSQKKYGKDYLRNSSAVDFESDSDDEILIREPSANPRRFNKRVSDDVENPSVQNYYSSDKVKLPPSSENPMLHRLNFSDSLSDSDSDDLKKSEKKTVTDQYNPSQYENLEVNEEVKDLFQYIFKYSPQQLSLDFKLKPFIPDFIPAVGDIDAFLKVIPPKKTITGEEFDAGELQLGLKILDEPATNQSDPALLYLQLRANSFNMGQTQESVVVKKVENVERNFKTIDKWIKDVMDLHKTKSAPVVRYSSPMPDLDDLMQEWPEEVENLLKVHGFPSYKFGSSLSDYIDVVCSLFDIPVDRNKIESLHMLFCLYAAVKNSQLYKSASEPIPKENLTTNVNNKPDHLILD